MDAFKGLVLFHHTGLCAVIGPIHSADVNEKLLDIIARQINVEVSSTTKRLK